MSIKTFRKITTYIKQVRKITHHHYRANKKAFLLLLSGIVFVSLTPFASSYIFKLIIDNIVDAIKNSSVELSPFIHLIALSIGLSLSERVVWQIIEYHERILHLDFDKYLTNLLAEKTSQLGFEHYSHPKTNDLLNRVHENNWRPMNFAERQLWIVQNVIQILSNALAIITLSWWVFLGILISSLPEFLIRVKYGKEVWGIWDTEGDTKRHFWNTRYYLRSEWFRNEISIFGARDFLLNKMNRLFETFLRLQKNKEKGKLALSILANLFITAIFSLSEVFIIIQTLASKITLGSLNFYNGRMYSLSQSFNSFFRNLGNSYEDLLYVEDLFSVLDLKNKVTDLPNAKELTQKPHTIEFRNAWFKYPNSKQYVLKNFNLKIGPHEKVALIGENGGGKTTIIRLLCRFYDVTKGEILIDGNNIKDLKLDSWYKSIGVLFQDFNRYDYSVKENIAIGNIDKRYEKDLMEKAARKSQAHEFINEYKKSYDTILSKQFEHGIDPSTGQWQKIALARAFFRDAPILILDEPTSAIDAEAEYKIFRQLDQFEKEKTVIMISHRFSTVRTVDQIHVIDKGKIVESGSHDTLMQEKGKYAKMFSLQAKGYQK